MDLGEALADLERRLQEQGAPIVRWLGVGVPPAVVEEQIGARFGVVPHELVTWFGWHNGTVPGAPSAMHETLLAYFPLSLHEAMRPVGFEGSLRPGRWLRLLSNGADAYILADCRDPIVSPIILYQYKDADEPVRLLSDSLQGFVMSWLELIDHGFGWDAERNGYDSADRGHLPLDLMRATALI